MRTLYAFLIVIVVLCAMPRNADAQLYVLLNNVSQIGNVSEYSPKGELINSNFITGLADPAGIAVSGNNLFVTDNVTDTVGKYDATTGGAINAGFIMGLQSPFAIAVLGNNLFVTYYTGQNHYAVGEYDATTGVAINANLITGLTQPLGSRCWTTNSSYDCNDQKWGDFFTVGKYGATSGAAINAKFITNLNLFAAEDNTLYGAVDNHNIGKYDATTGAVIDRSFIKVRVPLMLALLGNRLFLAKAVAQFTSGTVSEYDATTGAVISPNLITGLYLPQGIAVRRTK